MKLQSGPQVADPCSRPTRWKFSSVSIRVSVCVHTHTHTDDIAIAARKAEDPQKTFNKLEALAQTNCFKTKIRQ
jgi:hypothetical protein